MIKKTLTKIIVSVAIALLALSAAPAALLIADKTIASPFTQTFYGELSPMFERLKTSQKKKIVLLGNSAVAFGVDTALIEEELGYEGCDYDVCNFGLYGAIGTKTMLDFALPYFGKDDIAIIMPEESEQPMSTYFSPSENWKAIGDDENLKKAVPSSDLLSYVATFPGFVAEKASWKRKGITPDSGDIYSRSSFDEHCDLKNHERPYNIMAAHYDENNPILLPESLVSESFLKLVNGFADAVKEKGTTCYYAFAPMNEKAVKCEKADIAAFYLKLVNSLSFSPIHAPNTSIYPVNWFYDSNFHMNEAGMRLYTINLIDAIKNQLGLYGEIHAEIPDMPDLPTDPYEHGNDEDASCFLYEESGDGYEVIGLTEEGANRKSLIVPAMHNEKPVRSFSENTFKGNTVIEEITVQNNVRKFYDSSFEGCVNLRKLILTQEDPSKLSVGFHLMDGAPNCRIYVKANCLGSYQVNYFWGNYTRYYETY